MGALIRLLLRLLGRHVIVRRHNTFASQSTNLLPVRARWKPWVAAAVHAIPVLLVFIWIAVRRPSDVHASVGEVAAIWVTSSWCVIGPALIWTYERRTLPRFARSARRYLGRGQQFDQLRQLLLTNPLAEREGRVIMLIWLPLVFAGIVSSAQYLSSFGLYGYSDPLFWIVVFGVMYVAAYAGIGISFLVRSVKIIRHVACSEVRPNVYAGDGTLGLAFLGSFALSTNLMYLSGWLFMPALFVSMQHTSGSPVWVTHTLLAVGYAALCLVGFFWAINIVHQRIESIKCVLAEAYGARASACATVIMHGYSKEAADEFEGVRAAYHDVRSINDWPLSMDALVRFIASVVLFPLIVNILGVWWAT
jgi:hypothetical protein